MAQDREVEHTIRKLDGTIGEKNFYGNDPNPPKGEPRRLGVLDDKALSLLVLHALPGADVGEVMPCEPGGRDLDIAAGARVCGVSSRSAGWAGRAGW